MADVWIKRQPDGVWHVWGDVIRRAEGGWDEVARLKAQGHTVHWEPSDFDTFRAEFGDPPDEPAT
jgi:hypothetical protein